MFADRGKSESDRLVRLVERLQEPDRFAHSVESFETVETHISIVLLTGPVAYKFKKPLALDFLDFSTLERRREACRNELRLNRRTAPELYLDVVSVTGSVEAPRLDGDGDVLEYAVKMKQFSPDDRFDRMVRRGDVTDDMIDRTADRMAGLHERAEPVDPADDGSRADGFSETLRDTHEQLRDLQIERNGPVQGIDRVYEWGRSYLTGHQQLLDQRREAGYVRNLHGDLHLENVAWFDDQIVFFDCIEFNDTYRRIDVMDELAFLAMDLERLGAFSHAWQLVNRYLERTGDYGGVPLLPYFKVYRAMVRALVTGLKWKASERNDEQARAEQQMQAFLKQMEVPLKRGPAVLFLMHGLSGSGKTTVSQQLLQRFRGIRVRSDVERKRLHGLDPLQSVDTVETEVEGLYSEEATKRTYDQLRKHARVLLEARYPVFVDATFLHARHRERFRELADQLDVEVRIVHLQAPETELRQRVRERSRKREETVSDADERVLELQLRNRDPLTPDEQEVTITFSTEDESIEQMVHRIRNDFPQIQGERQPRPDSGRELDR